LVTGCDERSKLGTFIQVRIKDRMAEIETDDIGELQIKIIQKMLPIFFILQEGCT
jgi:hypothetical protein